MRRIVGVGVVGIALLACALLALFPIDRSATASQPAVSRGEASRPASRPASRDTVPGQSTTEAELFPNGIRGLVVEGSPDERRWTPIAGALVSFGDIVDVDSTFQARTDERGAFTIGFDRVPSFGYVVAEMTGFTTEGRSLTEARGSRPHVGVLFLHPSVETRGRVVDEQGAPIEGVDIRCESWRSPPNSTVLARSAADGSFTIADVPLRSSSFIATKPGYVLIPWDHFNEFKTLRMAREAPFTGRIFDELDAPVVGARVDLSEERYAPSSQRHPVWTDATGAYVLHGLPSPVPALTGSITKPGHLESLLWMTPMPAGGRFLLARAPLLRVRVANDASAEPIRVRELWFEWADARLSAPDGGRKLDGIEHDADGTIRAPWLRVDPARFPYFRIAARADDGAWAASAWEEQPAPGAAEVEARVTFPPTDTVRAVAVVHGTATPVPGVRARAIVRQDSFAAPYRIVVAVSGADGEIVFERLPRRFATVEVDSKDWLGAPYSFVVGETIRFALPVDRAARIVGTMTVDGRVQRRTYRVEAYVLDQNGGHDRLGNGDPVATAVTDLDGRFVLSPVPPGLVAVVPDFTLQPFTVPVRYALTQPWPPDFDAWRWRVLVKAGEETRVDVDVPAPR